MTPVTLNQRNWSPPYAGFLLNEKSTSTPERDKREYIILDVMQFCGKRK